MGVPKLSHRARTVKSETTAAEPPRTRNRAREGGGCGFGNRGHRDDCSLTCIAAPNLRKRNGEPKSIRRSLQKLPATLYIERFSNARRLVFHRRPRDFASKGTSSQKLRRQCRQKRAVERVKMKRCNFGNHETLRLVDDTSSHRNAWPSFRLFCGRTVAGRSAKRSANSDAVGKDERV
jgi:hypothetical protein